MSNKDVSDIYNVNISPNPFTDYLTISTNLQNDVKGITIYDIAGRAIETLTLNELNAKDFSMYVSGVYLLRITTGKMTSMMIKVVKI